MTVEERFMAKVEKHDANCPCCDGCWHWTAYVAPKGYGRFGLSGRARMAHNVSYELFVGPIPEGLQLDHLCRVRRCVNPAHLEPVTNAENARRAAAVRPRPSHCQRGHAYDFIRTDGSLGCRQCQREYRRLYDRQQREKRGALPAPALRTHCPQGHEYTPENTYLYQERRQCRTCRRAHVRASNARRAELSLR